MAICETIAFHVFFLTVWSQCHLSLSGLFDLNHLIYIIDLNHDLNHSNKKNHICVHTCVAVLTNIL